LYNYGVWHSRRSQLQKSLRASEQDRADIARRRPQWQGRQGKVSAPRLIFIDETWARTNMTARAFRPGMASGQAVSLRAKTQSGSGCAYSPTPCCGVAANGPFDRPRMTLPPTVNPARVSAIPAFPKLRPSYLPLNLLAASALCCRAHSARG
jgi:hypothetical protein